MSEKNYWLVRHRGLRVLITCPICDEWYEIPNSVEEMKCYRHCPWCGESLFLRKEDENNEA